jgi:hypothetical protein
MINFMKNNRKIIGTLSIMAMFSVWANIANASENRLEDIKQPEQVVVLLEESLKATEVAKVVSKAKEDQLEKYENATSLSDKDLKELLRLVGFKGQSLKEAWAIVKKESNGRPFAFNGNSNTGDSSYGIFQINMIGMLGPDRRNKFELDHNADLFNPVINAKIAYHMSKGGEDWRAWKGITPRTKELMSGFPH